MYRRQLLYLQPPLFHLSHPACAALYDRGRRYVQVHDGRETFDVGEVGTGGQVSEEP